MEGLLNALSSKNIFRPKVLAKVWRNGRGFVGSSIAVSAFLRPLCLHERIINFKPKLQKAVVFAEALSSPSDDQEKQSKWSSTAYGPPCLTEIGGKKRFCYNTTKDPCNKCQKTFKELRLFTSGTNDQSNRDESFLGACAEYFPVNELIPQDDIGMDTKREMQEKLQIHRENCSSLFTNIQRLCEVANEPNAEQRLRQRLRQDNHVVHSIDIFGFRPARKM